MNNMATLEVREAPSAAIVDIQGDLTSASDQALSAAYERAAAAANVVILNFSGLEYMNSSGIGLLVTLLIRANRQHKSLIVYGLNDHYRHIFQLTRLDDAIRIFDSEADALDAAGRAR
jgi:anti-sigma B factor antagonist